MRYLVRLILSAVAVYLLTLILPGVSFGSGEGDFIDALVVALVISLLNIFVRPLLVFLTIPATIVTLGLFLVVINAIIIWLTHKILDSFTVDNFWWALLFSVLLSILNSLFAGKEDPQQRND